MSKLIGTILNAEKGTLLSPSLTMIISFVAAGVAALVCLFSFIVWLKKSRNLGVVALFLSIIIIGALGFTTSFLTFSKVPSTYDKFIYIIIGVSVQGGLGLVALAFSIWTLKIAPHAPHAKQHKEKAKSADNFQTNEPIAVASAPIPTSRLDDMNTYSAELEKWFLLYKQGIINKAEYFSRKNDILASVEKIDKIDLQKSIGTKKASTKKHSKR